MGSCKCQYVVKFGFNTEHVFQDKLGFDPNKLAVGGASAGGGLAASLAHLVRDRAEFKFVFQLLYAPMLDDRTSLREHHPT